MGGYLLAFYAGGAFTTAAIVLAPLLDGRRVDALASAYSIGLWPLFLALALGHPPRRGGDS